MTENTGYVVAPLAKCQEVERDGDAVCAFPSARCEGCQRDGSRAVLEQAQRVELDHITEHCIPVWVPVDTEEQP